MSTHPLYLSDSELSYTSTAIEEEGKDDKGRYFIFKETIFRPEGGGQPADRGIITIGQEHFPLLDLCINKKGEIKHYISEKVRAKGEARLTLDLLWRHNLSAHHTAGHLLRSLVEKGYPAIKKNKEFHKPNRSYITFTLPKPTTPLFTEKELTYFLLKEMKKIEQKKRAILIDHSSAERTVQIEGLFRYPCTGTHLISTSDLYPITVNITIDPTLREMTLFYTVRRKDYS